VDVSFDSARVPTFESVRGAAGRLHGHAHRTPVFTSGSANAECGAQLYFKCENLQRVGAFKFRGAYNALALLEREQRDAGVVAFSSGNHAQAVALAARSLGVRATIVMPTDAPPVKLAATRGYGAEVVLYDRFREDREAIARELAEQRGLTVIPPFDHPDVIAGQGTSGLELLEEAGALDALFVCVGGGGLIAGCALAAEGLAPNCRVIGAEPEAGDDVRQSLVAGRRIRIETPRTIADGAQTQQVGAYPFEIIRRRVARIVPVPDSALVDAMRFFAERMKLIVEPTGCLAFAAVRQVAREFAGARIGVIVSGGNVDLARFADLIRPSHATA
jgi:threo-3-hydroxy-L-aspartate ammonia-lyase